MPQGQGRASVDVAPVTRTESRAAAIKLWTQSSLERRKSTSGALDFEGLRSNEQLQLQYCTDHMDGGTEATTALDEAASEPEHRTGTSTTGYRHSDMHSIIAEMRKNHVLSAYSPPILSAQYCASAAFDKLLLRSASACASSFCSSSYFKQEA